MTARLTGLASFGLTRQEGGLNRLSCKFVSVFRARVARVDARQTRVLVLQSGHIGEEGN
jgi:hypothetical protein